MSIRHLAALAVGAALAFSAPAHAMDEGTAAALDKVLAGDHRSEANKARDQWRRPKETLSFFGLTQGQTVVELSPGAGWYTEVLAPLMRDKGTYIAAGPDKDSERGAKAVARFKERLATRPDLYDKVVLTEFGPNDLEVAPKGTADLVLTFRNVHNWMAADWAPQAFKAMYDALKPGGTLGVVEHRAGTDQPQDPKAKSGYVRQDYVIKLAQDAGFKLVATSEINANPRDTKDHPEGVWTLPPSFALKDKDREKYAAIGESDRMTLRFVKPTAPAKK
ncbi:MAG TPA: methyltransferase [Azospirillaceae bacterium]|nr:methyltransferase [Azospirillaceae bacterium]